MPITTVDSLAPATDSILQVECFAVGMLLTPMLIIEREAFHKSISLYSILQMQLN